MKRIILFFVPALILSSCTGKTNTNSDTVTSNQQVSSSDTLIQKNGTQKLVSESQAKDTTIQESVKEERDIKITPKQFVTYKNWGAGGYYTFKSKLVSIFKSLDFKVDKTKSGKEEGEGGDLYPYKTTYLSRDINGNKISVIYHDGVCSYLEFKFSNPTERQIFIGQIKTLPHLKKEGNTYYDSDMDGLTFEIEGNKIEIYGFCP